MKEIVSLLITTSCLALAGLGIYFFSSKSNDTDDYQKGGKDNIVKYKRNEFKKNKSKNINISDNDNDNDNDSDSDSDNDSNSNELYNEPIKKRNNTKNNKTSKNKNKFTTSRKKYY
jgi:hypothetical protein